MVMTILGSIYQFERENIKERQAQGIEIAKREGKYRGGKCKQYDREIFEGLYKQYLEKKITKVQFAEKMGASRPTLDKWLRERATA